MSPRPPRGERDLTAQVNEGLRVGNMLKQRQGASTPCLSLFREISRTNLILLTSRPPQLETPMKYFDAEELVVGGTITEYREGSRFARAMLIGLGSANLASDVAFVDGQSGRQFTQAKLDLLWAMGGLVGASQGIEDLIEKAGRQIADAIAEQRGVAKKTETASRLLEPQIGGPSQDTKAGKCQG